MTAYRVGNIATYTTWMKAQRVVKAHPLLRLGMYKVDINIVHWLFLKSMGD